MRLAITPALGARATPKAFCMANDFQSTKTPSAMSTKTPQVNHAIQTLRRSLATPCVGALCTSNLIGRNGECKNRPRIKKPSVNARIKPIPMAEEGKFLNVESTRNLY